MGARCECAAVTGNRRCLSEKQSIETSRVLQRRDGKEKNSSGGQRGRRTDEGHDSNSNARQVKQSQ